MNPDISSACRATLGLRWSVTSLTQGEWTVLSPLAPVSGISGSSLSRNCAVFG